MAEPVSQGRAPPCLCAGAPGSTGTRALYGDLSQFERAFAEQAARLRRSARPGGSGLRGSDLKKSAVRRVVAGVSARLATGEGLDDQIVPVQRSG